MHLKNLNIEQKDLAKCFTKFLREFSSVIVCSESVNVLEIEEIILMEYIICKKILSSRVNYPRKYFNIFKVQKKKIVF